MISRNSILEQLVMLSMCFNQLLIFIHLSQALTKNAAFVELICWMKFNFFCCRSHAYKEEASCRIAFLSIKCLTSENLNNDSGSVTCRPTTPRGGIKFMTTHGKEMFPWKKTINYKNTIRIN